MLYAYEGRWVLQDNSSNGTYINGVRVRGQAVLNFGDRITLFELRLLYLGSYLAVCALSGSYEIRDDALAVYHPREGLVADAEETLRRKKCILSGRRAHSWSFTRTILRSKRRLS
ncbi:MAG: FHA domain-containing protein [Clostridiales bacterium]|nr:FHA domain-containing protein [Clostridiales bacterium]